MPFNKVYEKTVIDNEIFANGVFFPVEQAGIIFINRKECKGEFAYRRPKTALDSFRQFPHDSPRELIALNDFPQ